MKKRAGVPKKWPVEEGRYEVGNPTAPIAVCTEATVSGIQVNMDKVAIIGKCATENIGIEKIVKNVITNPYIRFLLICGKRSHGHDVGQTILSLSKNGVDKKMRVIGSKGSIPILRHLTREEIERFQKQVMVVDIQGETNSQKIAFKIDQYFKKNPGKFTGRPIKIRKLEKPKKIKCLKAKKPKEEYKPDPRGSFQILVDRDKKMIIAQHYNSDLELDVQIVGQDAKAIADTIIKVGLIGDFAESKDHAAYLGRELAKAQVCLENELEYIQDEPVVFSKSGEGLKKDEFGW